MKRIIINITTSLAAFVPMVAFAADGELNNITTLFENLLKLVNETLIPLMFAVAILAFFYGVFKFLIVGGGDESKRAEGKQLMLWAILGFVVMVSLYGIIAFVTDAVGIDEKDSSSVVLPIAPGGDGTSASGSGPR